MMKLQYSEPADLDSVPGVCTDSTRARVPVPVIIKFKL